LCCVLCLFCVCACVCFVCGGVCSRRQLQGCMGMHLHTTAWTASRMRCCTALHCTALLWSCAALRCSQAARIRRGNASCGSQAHPCLWAPLPSTPLMHVCCQMRHAQWCAGGALDQCTWRCGTTLQVFQHCAYPGGGCRTSGTKAKETSCGPRSRRPAGPRPRRLAVVQGQGD